MVSELMADWFRLDAEFAVHPKVVDLSDKAFRLHVETLGLVARLETDGGIKLGWSKASSLLVDELVDAGVWDRVDGELVVHDWHDYNPSHQEMVARTHAARNAARSRWRKAQGQGGAQADAKANAPANPMHVTEHIRNSNTHYSKVAIDLAERLKELLIKNDMPVVGKPEKWPEQMDVLLRKPGVHPAEAMEILEWSQTPDCWYIVRSGEAFKKKYFDLLASWRKKQQREGPRRDPTFDLPQMQEDE
jgi:hypothetical protein